MGDPLENRKVVVLGLARQGLAAAEWLTERAGAHVMASDIRPAEKLGEEALARLEGLPRLTLALGGHPLHLLDRASAVLVSGGVPLTISIIEEARRRGIRVTNDAQLFLERCPCHVVGITGSAGKTTTTTLVGKIMEAAGLLPWVGGNIGNPLISDLPFMQPDDIAVMELSSFQLELTTTSPRVAGILNITPNHLDRHGTMEAYINAKAQIIEHQMVGDVAVLNQDDPTVMGLADRLKAGVSHFSARVPVDVGAWLVGQTIVCRPAFDQPMEEVIAVDDIKLRGWHNVLNVLAACAISGAAGVPPAAMREAVLSFTGVAHRLEVVREVGGVTYINDSIATAPERVTAAIRAFDEPLVLLLGGKDKDLPWDEMLRLALGRARSIITFGDAGPMVAQLAITIQKMTGTQTPITQAGPLAEAFQLAVKAAQPGDVVLLSPGGTSYDAYTDFAERGEDFRQMVRAL